MFLIVPTHVIIRNDLIYITSTSPLYLNHPSSYVSRTYPGMYSPYISLYKNEFNIHYRTTFKKPSPHTSFPNIPSNVHSIQFLVPQLVISNTLPVHFITKMNFNIHYSTTIQKSPFHLYSPNIPSNVHSIQFLLQTTHVDRCLASCDVHLMN